MKSDFEIVEDYIRYYNETDFVNSLSIPEQVLYKLTIIDTYSFMFYKLYIRLKEFFKLFVN